jgi:hypothetical protein
MTSSMTSSTTSSMANSTSLSTEALILKLITSSTVKYRDLSTSPITEPLDRKKILNAVNKMIKQKQLKLNHNGTPEKHNWHRFY